MKKQREIHCDISAVPIRKQETHLPVLVDVTHSTGRKDILFHVQKQRLLSVLTVLWQKVHPDPAVALSDSAQQMDLDQFDAFYSQLVASHYVKA